MSSGPLVSVVMATRDRPTLFALALRYFQEQTYAQRELVVIDDGERFPVDPAAVAAVGGRLLRVRPGTTVGEKHNVGVRATSGAVCQIMDDDDYYAPDFLAALMRSRLAASGVICYPHFTGVARYLQLDVRRWEVRRITWWQPAGGTLQFAREDWQACPFRPVMRSSDTWFIRDQTRLGAQSCPVVDLPEIFVYVRHQGGGGNLGHSWAMQKPGVTVEDASLGLPLYGKEPEAVLPAWALPTYRRLRQDVSAAEDGASRAVRP